MAVDRSFGHPAPRHTQASQALGGYGLLVHSFATSCSSHYHLYSPVGAITDLALVAVNTLSSGLIDGKLSGILGLAFQGIANTRAVPFWQALIANNLLTNPEFSFFITRFINDQSAAQEEPGGVFTLGGTNSTLFQGDIDFRTFTSVGSGGSFWSQTVSGE